ncbi:unnamed protein product [Linum tenue]|uniref:DNA-3-methyladenine glycosylase I n=1 Tax=Linum tenue TaxID=586396 RepID=A0AAV0QM56_9ROSI|nr:unnamed protein product [Linum tenue]
MCSSKLQQQQHNAATATATPPVVQIDGRPVLQPKSNQVPTLDRRNSLKKTSAPTTKSPLPILPLNLTKPKSAQPLSPPVSPTTPKITSPRPKRSPTNDHSNNQSLLAPISEKPSTTPRMLRKAASFTLDRKTTTTSSHNSFEPSSLSFASSLIVEAPGTIAAARREHVAIMQEQRKMRIVHYGRTKSAKIMVSPPVVDSSPDEDKRCSFITPNSDPIYVAYHDLEWGVPVHDDKLLLELLVLTGAQVGSDWTSVLKRRESLREAFSGFDPQVVAKFNEKKMNSISAEYGIDICQVRGIVDNSSRILEVVKEFGSFDKYLWRFVNQKPIQTQYRWSHKIPVKTSKSESISKDMQKRGFRLVGPTVIHSFMQAAGLSNDHLITCPRHLQCTLSASQSN